MYMHRNVLRVHHMIGFVFQVVNYRQIVVQVGTKVIRALPILSIRHLTVNAVQILEQRWENYGIAIVQDQSNQTVVLFYVKSQQLNHIILTNQTLLFSIAILTLIIVIMKFK